MVEHIHLLSSAHLHPPCHFPTGVMREGKNKKDRVDNYNSRGMETKNLFSLNRKG